ncbi:hypothetical protein CH063_04074, partial [Colletotrichum higginsianum]
MPSPRRIPSNTDRLGQFHPAVAFPHLTRIQNTAPSTYSLSNSFFQYRIENGRTYHRYKYGKYY